MIKRKEFKKHVVGDFSCCHKPQKSRFDLTALKKSLNLI
jgi:hypothetical protein